MPEKNLPQGSDSRSKFRDLGNQPDINKPEEGEITEDEAKKYLGGVPYEVGRASAEEPSQNYGSTEPRR